jgi:hypothetical protein
MKIKVLATAAVLFCAGIVSAQPTPFAPAQQQVALDSSSPIEALVASPVAKPILLKHFPGLDTHPAYEQIKGMSLRDVAPFSGGVITDEKIAALDADLKAVK